MTDQEQLDALLTEVNKLNAKARALKASIEATEKVLEADKEALKKLVGSLYTGSGEIPYKRSQIEELERNIEDGKKPRVVWKEGSLREGNYIIDKVTPKRIAVKQVGHTHCEQFNRDGTPVSRYGYGCNEIDLKATFGDDYNVDD